MRTVATNVYNYFELSEKAKDKAYEDFCATCEYPYHYENENCLEKLEGMFDVTVNNWEYSMYDYRFDLHVDNEELKELSGKELVEYLKDNFGVYMEHKKDIYGYFLDYSFLDEISYMLPKLEHNEMTYYDVMKKCFNLFFDNICDDIQNYYSIGSFEDLTEMNEWEYLENGELY